MGRRGPPPKPTKLKIAAGNPGKRKLNKSEPKPDTKAPTMPVWLSETAKVEWKRIVPELVHLGLLASIDLAALASYCQAYSELEQATRTLDQEGRMCVWIITNKAGEKIGEKLRSHPAVQQQRDAARLVKQFITEFGLTPASRSRVAGVQAEDRPADPRGAKFFA